MKIDAGAHDASPVTLAAARGKFDADVTCLDTATFGLPPRRSWVALQQALALGGGRQIPRAVVRVVPARLPWPPEALVIARSAA